MIGAPATLERATGISASATRLAGKFDHIHAFVLTESRLHRMFARLKAHLRDGGALWISWPKARGLGTDLTLPTVIRIGYEHGLVESKTISVDATWSALKFTYPRAGKVYDNRYGRLPTTPRNAGQRNRVARRSPKADGQRA